MVIKVLNVSDWLNVWILTDTITPPPFFFFQLLSNWWKINQFGYEGKLLCTCIYFFPTEWSFLIHQFQKQLLIGQHIREPTSTCKKKKNNLVSLSTVIELCSFHWRYFHCCFNHNILSWNTDINNISLCWHQNFKTYFRSIRMLW